AAAAFPVPALTAGQVLSDTLGVRAGEHLLVHGAGGVTGGLLVALAVLHGAQVIATAGPSSRQRVTALGARHVIDYHDHDWPMQVAACCTRASVSTATLHLKALVRSAPTVIRPWLPQMTALRVPRTFTIASPNSVLLLGMNGMTGTGPREYVTMLIRTASIG